MFLQMRKMSNNSIIDIDRFNTVKVRPIWAAIVKNKQKRSKRLRFDN